MHLWPSSPGQQGHRQPMATSTEMAGPTSRCSGPRPASGGSLTRARRVTPRFNGQGVATSRYPVITMATAGPISRSIVPRPAIWSSLVGHRLHGVRVSVGQHRRHPGASRLRWRRQDRHRGVSSLDRQLVRPEVEHDGFTASESMRGASAATFRCRVTTMATAGPISRCIVPATATGSS